MDKWLYLAGGGILGTFARYALGSAVYQRTGMDFPYGTMVVNVLGCFLVGFLDVLIERKFTFTPQLRLLFVTGFCGAFTTFSAFILESYALVREGSMLQALANVTVSVVAGFIVFRLGMLAAEALF